jgi:HPt (histidine-containing phosphotransfer) domain-containing protein
VAEIVHHIKPNLAALGIVEAEPLVAQLENYRQLSGASPAEAERIRATVAELVALLERVLQLLPSELPVD